MMTTGNGKDTSDDTPLGDEDTGPITLDRPGIPDDPEAVLSLLGTHSLQLADIQRRLKQVDDVQVANEKKLDLIASQVTAIAEHRFVLNEDSRQVRVALEALTKAIHGLKP